MTGVTHVLDDNDRWRVIVEVDRRTRMMVALIPKQCTAADVVLFTDNVLTAMRRKLLEEARRENERGKAEGKSEGKVSGPDEAGAPPKEEDPKGGGPKGGGDPT